jgi:hypothetical protein
MFHLVSFHMLVDIAKSKVTLQNHYSVFISSLFTLSDPSKTITVPVVLSGFLLGILRMFGSSKTISEESYVRIYRKVEGRKDPYGNRTQIRFVSMPERSEGILTSGKVCTIPTDLFRMGVSNPILLYYRESK